MKLREVNTKAVITVGTGAELMIGEKKNKDTQYLLSSSLLPQSHQPHFLAVHLPKSHLQCIVQKDTDLHVSKCFLTLAMAPSKNVNWNNCKTGIFHKTFVNKALFPEQNGHFLIN